MASNPHPLMPADLAEVIALHREMFGGYRMMADDAGEQSNDGQNPPAEQEKDDDAGADLGDGGKRALDAERRARKAAEKKAADAQAELDKIAEANKTEAEKAADRATKAEQERDALQAQIATMRREAAVYRLAGTADPAALLDSRAFTDAIADVDADDDKAITAAIKDAIKANPRLARTRSTGGDLHEGLHQQAAPTTTATGTSRMSAAFDALMGTN